MREIVHVWLFHSVGCYMAFQSNYPHIFLICMVFSSMRSPVDEDIITLGQFFCDNIGNWLSELLNKVQKYDSDFKVKRSN